MKSMRFTSLLTTLLCTTKLLQAQDAHTPAATAATNTSTNTDKGQSTKKTDSADSGNINTNTLNLRGLGFGVGVGAIFDIGGSPRIKNATTDANGIVRVQTEDSVRVGAVLETHYLFGLDNHVFKDADQPARTFYNGPQVSAVLGSDNIIDGVGVGYMVAFRRKNTESQSFSLKSFNLGFGAMIQPNAQKLGDGLQINQPLPKGDQIRYKNVAQAGMYIVFSAGF